MPYTCQQELVAFMTGNIVGDGQCVALVQQCTRAPHTSSWRQGSPVRGNIGIQRGAAVATFEKGKYPNQAHGNHAAIYISQDAKGIQVYDQWASNKLGVHVRTIKWGGEDPSNDGNAFSVIE